MSTPSHTRSGSGTSRFRRFIRVLPGCARRNPGGMTMIELLIVVAIIAILAASAVPNYLEAQTRAKASRAQADQRSLATAIESYATDYGKYPCYGNPRDYAPFAGEAVVFVPLGLTTPTAYMTSLPPDIFPGHRTGLAAGDKANTYFYMNNYACVYLGRAQEEGHVQSHYRALTGTDRPVRWTVWSFGPDLDDDHGVTLYDPTNGTVSSGDLMRFGP
jgi:prepilin-type N-terminal cleavage/methylation domain-containing protein